MLSRLILRICGDYLSWCQNWALLGLIVQIVHILYCLTFEAICNIFVNES